MWKNVMHSKSDNMKVMSHNKPDEVMGELLSHFILDTKSGQKH